MAANSLNHARSKFHFLVEDHDFEEASSWETTQELLKFHRNEGDNHPGMTIIIGFGFGSIPTLAFQLREGNTRRTFPIFECRTQATVPLIAEFQKLTNKKTLDQAYQMWRKGEFDEIFNVVVDEFARIIQDNIEEIKQGEVQEIVNQMKQNRRSRKTKA